MSAPLPLPRWQRRADARPGELLEAALALFVERGYAATRLEEVARRAGVAKATLYLYYENKLELFKAVVRNSLVAGLDEMAATLSSDTVSAREQLARLLTAFVRRVAGSPLSGIPKLVIAEAGNFPEIARFYHDEVIQRGRAMVMGTLARGAASGEFRPLDADYAWRIVIAPLLLSIIWKHSFQPFEPEPLDFLSGRRQAPYGRKVTIGSGDFSTAVCPALIMLSCYRESRARLHRDPRMHRRYDGRKNNKQSREAGRGTGTDLPVYRQR